MYMYRVYRPVMATISISLDDRITRVFAAKLAETEAAEASLAKTKARYEAASNSYNSLLNAATHGQGDWGMIGTAHVVQKQCEKMMMDQQETVSKLNNQLSGMRKTFWNEAERGALNACEQKPAS